MLGSVPWSLISVFHCTSVFLQGQEWGNSPGKMVIGIKMIVSLRDILPYSVFVTLHEALVEVPLLL